MNSEKVEPDGPFKDKRFLEIIQISIHIRQLISEINKLTQIKLNDLIGIPKNDESEKLKNNTCNCWLDKVISEQKSTIELCENILKRLDEF